jgi:hypothetical protein
VCGAQGGICRVNTFFSIPYLVFFFFIKPKIYPPSLVFHRLRNERKRKYSQSRLSVYWPGFEPRALRIQFRSINAWASFLGRKRVRRLMWEHNDTQVDRKFKVCEVAKRVEGVGGLHRVRNWLRPTSGGDRTTDALIFFSKTFLSRSAADRWLEHVQTC